MSVPGGERRVVSVLLADVADSTAIGERLGPERSKFLFDEVVRLIAGEIKRFGGTVAQLTGDGLYALFGVPNAHEDDAERAVRAALAVQEAIARYGADVEEAYGVELSTRIGVNTGTVVLLPEHAPPEERYNALGDTVNVAARLQSHADRGGVVVGPTTARQVEGAFELEPLGPVELKGKGKGLEAFRVGAERAAAPSRRSPLVGRDRELQVLDELLSDLAEGKGSIASITGEPGIGKSRLVFEARERWSGSVRFLGAQGVSYAEEVPYYPLRQLLRGFLELGVGDPEARVRLELKARLARLLGDRADAYYPFLAQLLGLRLEEDVAERLERIARDSIQRQTHEAVLELCRALSYTRPFCLLLEDLQFADEPTLELCEELLQLADEEAVTILLLYRSDPDAPSWKLGEAARRRYRHRFRELQLEPLDSEDGARLAASAAGGDLPAAVAAELAERTGGNPLFLEEAARDLVERGNGAVVPAAIQETVQARLDRLAPETREVAAVAAVVGRTFGAPLLERLVSGERLRSALSELQRHDLVVEERRRPTPEYRFRHGLVRDAAYRSLLDDRRRDLHRVVGTALEELHGDELSEAYGLLARHFSEADEPAKAARYLLEAGDAARAVYADEEAIAHYQRALPSLDRLGDSGRARGVLFKIAVAHHLAFEFEDANAAWAEAFTRPEPPPRRLEPTERIATAASGGLPGHVPGYSYDIGSWTFTPNLFRGLLTHEQGLDVVPDVAEHISVSADGRVYRFRLRDSARWSDGEHVTAEDFAHAYRMMREEAVHTAQFLEGIEADAITRGELELRLEQPRPYFPYLLAYPAFFPWPRHSVEELGDAWRSRPGLIGNGPFVLQKLTDDHALLTANPEWHGARGNVADIEIKFQPSPEDDWRAGRYDVLFWADSVSDLEDAPETLALTVPLMGTNYVGFNPERPPLNDERVRRALAHGLDRERVVRGTRKTPAYGGFLPPAMPGHSHDLAPPHDLARARALLAEAGFPEGRGLPELRLLHVSTAGTERVRDELETRWRQWSELGITIRQDWMELEAAFVPGTVEGFHLWRWGFNADYPDPDGHIGSLVDWFRSWKVSGRRADLEGLVERARSLRSRDERLALYREADRQLVAEQVLVTPTTYESESLAYRRWIEGAWTSPLTISPLSDLVVRPH
jgi:ABC-type transport system substrate-binding protein/class 3 adenylate cyclase